MNVECVSSFLSRELRRRTKQNKNQRLGNQSAVTACMLPLSLIPCHVPSSFSFSTIQSGGGGGGRGLDYMWDLNLSSRRQSHLLEKTIPVSDGPRKEGDFTVGSPACWKILAICCIALP